MTQKEIIKKHLEDKGSMTNWDCIVEHHITRSSEYIRQLRQDGYEIETNYPKKENGKQQDWCIYNLIKKTHCNEQ